MPQDNSVPARPRLLPAALAVFVSLAAASCLNTVDVEGSDDSVLFAGGRVSYRITPESSAASPAAAEVEALAPQDEQARPTFLLELDGSYGEGGDEVHIAAGDSVTFAGTTFAGPDELTLGFDLGRIRANARAVLPFGDGFSLQFLAGLEYSAMAIYVDNSPYVPPAPAKSTLNAIGPALGLALAWSPVRWLELSGEAAYSFGFSSEADLVGIGACDAGASLWPRDRVALFLGWRWVRYRAEGLDVALSSDVDLDLAGPVIALRLGF